MYDELYERYLESDDVVVPPAPRIAAYVEALVAQYPDDVDRNVVWASTPVIDEASGPIVYLLMSYGKAGAALDHDLDPDRMSFTRSLRIVRRQVPAQAAFSPRQTRPGTDPHLD